VHDLILRQATQADVAVIVNLIRQAFEEYRGRLDPPSGAHEETEERVRLKMASSQVVVVLAGDVPVACVFYERESDYLHFHRLSVLPAYRRRGVGRLLIDYVENRARALGLTGVRLGVRLALERLRSYYDRLGYRFREYRTHSGYPEPTYAILEKDLRRAEAG
jgi:ribosomal protein S18 acetylase RimI-like enzyme